jgi:hypothetical protein
MTWLEIAQQLLSIILGLAASNGASDQDVDQLIATARAKRTPKVEADRKEERDLIGG